MSSSLEYRRQVFFSSQHSAASCAAALSRRRSRRGSSPVAARGCWWLVRMSICHALPLTKRCVPPRFDVRSPADAEVAARPDHGAAPLLPCPAPGQRWRSDHRASQTCWRIERRLWVRRARSQPAHLRLCPRNRKRSDSHSIGRSATIDCCGERLVVKLDVGLDQSECRA